MYIQNSKPVYIYTCIQLINFHQMATEIYMYQTEVHMNNYRLNYVFQINQSNARIYMYSNVFDLGV